LTLPRLIALQAEWRARPPAHWLLASALHYRAPGAGAASLRQTSVAQFLATFPDARS
jgi:hypothetical protein